MWVLVFLIPIVAILSDAVVKREKYRSQSGLDKQELTQLLDQLRDEHAALHEELMAIDQKVSSIEKMMKEV